MYIKSITVTYTESGGPTHVGPTTYKRVSSANDLVADQKYIIVYENGTSSAVMGELTGGSTARRFSAITGQTVTNHKIDVAGANGVQQLTLGGSTDAWTLNTGSGYIYGNDAPTFSIVETATLGAAQWVISTDGLIQNRSNDSRYIRYYTTSPSFRHYPQNESGSANAYLYVQYDATTPLELTLNPATGTAECGESINVDVTANTALNVVYNYTVYPATGATVTPTDGGFSITATTAGTYTVTVSALDDIDREATTTGTYTFTQTGGETSSNLFTKVTSTADLMPGKKYIIVREAIDSPEALMGAGTTTTVAWSGNDINIEGTDAKVLNLGSKGTSGYSFSYVSDGTTYYMEATSRDISYKTSSATTWTVHDDDGDGFYLMHDSYYLVYNSGASSSPFRCYTSVNNSYEMVYLYVQASTDPTLSVSPETLTLTDIPYDGTSTSGTFNVTGAHLTGTTVTVSVTGEGFSVQPTSIYVVDGTVDQQVTVTYSGTSTTEVQGIVTVTCGDLSQQVTVTAKKATPPPATLTATPTSLTISDSGNGNTFNVTGSYLGTDDVGVTVPQGSQFSTTTDDQTWGFENKNGSVSGTVTVTYGGRDLAASETVTIANNQTSTTVNVNYVTDLYVVGNYGSGWNFADSQQMTYNNGTYTTTINAPAGSYILFARTTGVSYGWEDDANRLFVGAVTDGGDWEYGIYTSGTLDTDPNNDNPVKYHPIYFADAATYVITIDAATGTFAITRQEIKSDDFVLVTSTSDITADDEYVLVYTSVAGLDDHAMSTSYSSNVYGQTTEGFTLENDVVTLSDPTTVNVLTLKDAGNDTFYILAEGDNNDEYYLNYSGNSNNVLRNANNGETDSYKWNISIDEYGDVEIQNVGSTDRYLQYNAANSRYACYKTTSNQQNAKLYKRGTVVKVAAPVITPEGGTSNKRFGAFDVTITADQGCTIHYTTDGTAPTASSETYTEPFTLPYGSAPTTVKAIAIDGNGNVSRVTTVVYYWDRVQVAISPASQQVTAPVQVTITPTPSDATVTYTINGGATVTYTEPFTVNVTEANPEAVVVATATKGESTATATVTYIYKRDYVNSVKEFNELVGANETVEFKNPVVVLFDYSQQGNQDYIWIKDHTGYAQLFIQPGFDKDGTNKRLPRYDNGDVIPGGFKVTKRFYTDGDANFWEGYSDDNTVNNFAVPQDKALADPEMVKLSDLINTPSNYNNRYLYMTKVKITNGNWGYNNNGFYLAADEGGSTVANNDVVKGYNKFNPWYNTGNTKHDVIVPTDGEYYNVTFIFQKYSTYYEVMPIEFTPWEDNTLRLEELVKTGVQGNTYTISNPLIAAKVTWDDNYKQFAIFAKDDSMSVAKRYPTSDMGSYVIRYENGDFVNNVPQEDYDQSNWIEILIPSSVTNKTANSAAYTAELEAQQRQYEGKILPGGSIANGTYLDTLNPTIRVTGLNATLLPTAYTPNIYCTANFLMENLDADGANSYRDGYGQYFMMDAKPQEFCKIVWAYMIGTDNYFVAPMQEGDDINGLNFNGSFLADMSLCEEAEITCETQAQNCFDPSNAQQYGNEQALYSFNAIVRKNPASPVWSGTSNAPRHIQPKSDGKETVPAYIVYPLNAGANSEIITAVRELSTDKTIDSVRYFNIMGMESEQPFHGINIVVTRYTDGTTSTAKVLR